jgi:peptide subunit release factor 1 (eRF1)
MITIAEIQALASRPEHKENSVLTLYLNIDQSRQANLNRGFENELKDLLASARDKIQGSAELEAFEKAAGRVQEFVAGHSVRARGLAAFCDSADGFFWGEEMDFPVENRVRWGREASVQPLVAAIDEYERVGIVLLDRAKLRLFTMSLGQVEERIREDFDTRKVRHTKTVGMDHLASASRAQRKADGQVHMNLRHAVKDIDWLLGRHVTRRIVLAGLPEVTAELRGTLPKRLGSLVIGEIDVAVGATLDEISTAVAPVGDRFERETERSIVDNLVTSAAKSTRATIGLAHTLHALNQRRVWQLVYADGVHTSGYECVNCDALFSSEDSACALCGSPMSRVDDVVERAVDHAFRKGIGVEVIRDGEAESSLINAGGIGAFLRTRSARRAS